MTWEKTVFTTLDKIGEVASNTDDELKQEIYKQLYEKTKDYFDTISLARIASALYKIAELEDNVTEEELTGGLR